MTVVARVMICFVKGDRRAAGSVRRIHSGSARKSIIQPAAALMVLVVDVVRLIASDYRCCVEASRHRGIGLFIAPAPVT